MPKMNPQVALELIAGIQTGFTTELARVEMGLHLSGYHRDSTRVANARNSIERTLGELQVDIFESNEH